MKILIYHNISTNSIDIDDVFIDNVIKPIEYLHTNNIVHLDLKLENYLVENTNNYILIDFYGSQEHLYDYYKMIEIENPIYTYYYYSSPEYLNGYYSKSSDIYI